MTTKPDQPAIARAQRLWDALVALGTSGEAEYLGEPVKAVTFAADRWPFAVARIAYELGTPERDNANLRAALRVAEVAFDCLDPANHGQTSDAELAKLITTASHTVSEALREVPHA